MKRTRPIVVLLLLNLVVFAGILGYFLRARLVAPLPAGTADPVANLPSTSPPGKNLLFGPVATVTNSFEWAQLESEDYKTYVARLRAVGCPEATLRDIIIADLDKLLAGELRAATGRRTDLRYWHPEEEELMNDVDPRLVSKTERELNKRKRDIIRELVGADLAQERMKASGEEDYYERRLGFLPEELRSKVRDVLERFDEAEQQIRDKDSEEIGGLQTADQATLRALRQERSRQVEGLLSPQEKQLYELWFSPVANDVRHATYGMSASEEEFRAIYQARKQFDDAWGSREPESLDPGAHQAMEQARAEMEAQIHSSLGDQRYAEYARGQDDDFHLLSALVTRFKLPKEKASEVYGYKTVAMGYRQQILQDPTLNPEQKDLALREINSETQKSVQGVLGTKAFNYYVRSGQAKWISSPGQ